MTEDKKILATPKVRKFARELGANVSDIKGTERKGRITEHDVKSYIANQLNSETEKFSKKNKTEFNHSEFGEVEIKDMPRIKKIAAPHLVNSWTTIPHVTHHDEADITEMEEFRNSITDTFTGEKKKFTPLTFIIKSQVATLKIFQNFNTSIDDIENGKIVIKKYFHIGIAVDTPHGLMVPKMRNVDKKNVNKINNELKILSEKCRNLKIDKKEFFGGSMTISSLGGIGGTFFTPIINPPEVAILGVGKSFDRLVKIKGQIVSRKILPISLSYDHRIIDGAEGVRFCVHLNKSLGKDFAFKLAV